MCGTGESEAKHSQDDMSLISSLIDATTNKKEKRIFSSNSASLSCAAAAATAVHDDGLHHQYFPIARRRFMQNEEVFMRQRDNKRSVEMRKNEMNILVYIFDKKKETTTRYSLHAVVAGASHRPKARM